MVIAISSLHKNAKRVSNESMYDVQLQKKNENKSKPKNNTIKCFLMSILQKKMKNVCWIINLTSDFEIF